MKSALLCLCLVSTIGAAPMKTFYEYLPQAGVPQQRSGPYFPLAQPPPQPGLNGPVSIEMVMMPRYSSNGPAGEPNSPQVFLKYKMPKTPGMKSMEIFYPIDYTQQQQIFSRYGLMPPMLPQQNQNQNVFPPNTMPQNGPQNPSPPQAQAQPPPKAQGQAQAQPPAQAVQSGTKLSGAAVN
ncbi:secretory calcium-binding phosphoprotein 5 [Paramormyrops kingsleyae]|uniref:secretory calcium-binding phosphoprotein 5 n=1 Tax=Paramormyrops kingsleyae TaxID=1676925 RepID=UPI003B9777D7